MILLQLIRYENAPALEASWGELIKLPDVEIPAVLDGEGNEVEPARVEPGGVQAVVHKCQAYANNQMAELAADLGPDAPQYQALMNEIAATYVPPVFDIAAARAAKNEQINTWRLQANRGTFAHGGKHFACDELSRSDIDGITSFVALAGTLPPGWPGAWKAVDNSYLPIASVAEWAAFVASMVAAGNANFAKAQALKATLASAATQAEIDAIVW